MRDIAAKIDSDAGMVAHSEFAVSTAETDRCGHMWTRATHPHVMRRVMLVFGVAATVAAIIISCVAVLSPQSVLSAKCPAGESEDLFTGVCVPELSPSVVQLTPSVFGGAPEVDGVPCTGHNSYECIGLAEEALGSGPTPSPNATVSAQTEAPSSSAPVAPTHTGPPTGQNLTLTPNPPASNG